MTGLGCPAAAACAMCAALVLAVGARAGTLASPLAVAVVGGDSEPSLLLAQRAIDREWGTPEDSVDVDVPVPGWKSEGVAMAMSAAVPGAGQAYVGSTSHAIWFLAAEVAGWAAHWAFTDRGNQLRDDAATYAGVPSDTTSNWAFARMEQTSPVDAAALRVLYSQDREAFYDRIGNDARYLPGWGGGDPAATRVPFQDLRESSDTRLNHAHQAESAIWINHLVSAFDALREARLRDMSLGHELKLRVGGRWKHGSPTLSASLMRSF
jgi:hypothetical protein